MPVSARSYSCGPLGRVRKLTDLTGFWVNKNVPDALNVGASLLDIETNPTNGEHVYVVGEAKPGVGLFPSYNGVAVSTDGGTTWNIPGGNYINAPLANLGIGLLFQWNEIVVVDNLISYIVGSAVASTQFAAVAKSTDGGLTYNLIVWQGGVPVPQYPNLAGLIDKHAYSVHFPTATLGVIGLDNYVIKTTDGGINWLILNDGQPLSTSSPAPGTVLPIGPITGINIRPDESHIIGVGQEFIVETILSVPPAGVLADSWRNAPITSSPPGVDPVFSGFTFNQHLGYHLTGFPIPNNEVIHISGDNSLGIGSPDHGQSTWDLYSNSPGWNSVPATGFSRRAAHFYNVQGGSVYNGFYNKDQTVYHNINGFNGFSEVLSDNAGSGLDYIPNALWTWYQNIEETCYQLIACPPGAPTIITNTNLSAVLGQVIKIVGQTGCYTVLTAPDCTGAVAVVINGGPYVDCTECAPPPPSPCTCPQGTIEVILPNGSKVCRQDIVTPAQGHDPRTGCVMVAAVIGCADCGAGNFNPSTTYNQYGARFYQDLSIRPWPISPYTDPSCIIPNFYFRDNSATIVAATNATTNSLWGNGIVTDGRHNNAAVWNHFWSPTTCAANPLTGLYGFTHCLTVATTTTYFFATSGRAFQLRINGTVAVENLTGTTFGTDTLHVFPITLPAGTYVIEMTGAEVGTGICNTIPPTTTGFVWEIYSGVGLTSAALAAMTTTIQLSAVTVYSTLNESGNYFDYGTTTFNNSCPAGQALDNCFTGNPNIYVCHNYVDTPISGCCYILTDCTNPSITYITSSDLSAYLYQNTVITVNEYVGCFTVSLAPDCGPFTPPIVTGIQSFADCNACTPVCYQLVDCQGIVANILTNTDLSIYLNTSTIIKIAGSNTCWTVQAAGGCQGSIPVSVVGTYSSCIECNPVCYQLTNCINPNDTKITSTDLSLYIGQVVYIDGCPGICYQVTTAGSCNNSIPVAVNTIFADCSACAGITPAPPVELRPRSVKPGYNTPGCSPAYTEKVSCNFANAVYDEMVIKRYGVTLCCNLPIVPWSIKKQLLDLNAIYNPDLCKNTFEICCPPCAMFAELVVYRPTICSPPTNMVAELITPPATCPAPTNMQVNISIPVTGPCVCYYIIVSGVCTFDYIDCFDVPRQITPSVSTYLCSKVLPTSACPPSDYSIQTTPGDCLLGTCGP